MSESRRNNNNERRDEREDSASRNSHHMRGAVGFYPTTKGNDGEWRVYKILNANVVEWLREHRISGANAREHMKEIAEFAANEARSLWDNVRRDRDLEGLLPNEKSCLAYVYSAIYGAMGSFESYLSRKRRRERDGGDNE